MTPSELNGDQNIIMLVPKIYICYYYARDKLWYNMGLNCKLSILKSSSVCRYPQLKNEHYRKLKETIHPRFKIYHEQCFLLNPLKILMLLGVGRQSSRANKSWGSFLKRGKKRNNALLKVFHLNSSSNRCDMTKKASANH